jgi:hypothetical protein
VRVNPANPVGVGNRDNPTNSYNPGRGGARSNREERLAPVARPWASAPDPAAKAAQAAVVGTGWNPLNQGAKVANNADRPRDREASGREKGLLGARCADSPQGGQNREGVDNPQERRDREGVDSPQERRDREGAAVPGAVGPAAVGAVAAGVVNEHHRGLFCRWRNSGRSPIRSA